MDMPEGFENAAKELRDNKEPHRYVIQHMMYLMKEMAEALENATLTNRVYLTDTLLIMKKEEDAKAIANEISKQEKVLKKFKDWK